MSDKRDLVRNKILRVQDECYRRDISEEEDCTDCPFDLECSFLLSFDTWCHMRNLRKEGDEDLEQLVDDVMTVEDYEDLLEIYEKESARPSKYIRITLYPNKQSD